LRRKQFQYKYLQLSLIVLVGTIFLSTSCSTQKRKYVKGFYIEHISKKQENKTLLSQANVDIKTNSLNQYQASSSDKIELVSENKNLIVTNAPTANCDTIILNSGVKMIVKVISAGEQTVIYKSCESNKDEFLNIERSKVNSIHYASGKTDEKDEPINPADDYNKPQKPFNSAKNAEAEKGVKQLEKASFWFLLSRYIGFGFIVGFILATCAKNNFKGKVGYESEFKTARFLHILGLVLIFVTLIPIVYILVMAFLI
jgi:deoxycytidylate deaminase